MAVNARKTSKPASRLRRLAASAVAAPAILVALAPIGVLAAGTVVIDSRGAYQVQSFGKAAMTGDRGDGAVTLDLSVLDGYGRAGPPPIQLRRPSSLIANAEPIRLRPPRSKLTPPPAAGRAGAQLALHAPLPDSPPLPPRRPGTGMAIGPEQGAVQLASLPPLPPRRPAVSVDPAALGSAAAPTTESRTVRLRPVSGSASPALATTPAPTPMAKPATAAAAQPMYAPSPAPISDAATDLPPPPAPTAIAPVLLPQSRQPSPPPPSPATPRQTAFLQTPAPDAVALAAAPTAADRTPPRRPQPDPRPTPGPAIETRAPATPRPAAEAEPSVGSEQLRRRLARFDAERETPPAMAVPGWRNPAPAAVAEAVTRVADLPDLASLAPPETRAGTPPPPAPDIPAPPLASLPQTPPGAKAFDDLLPPVSADAPGAGAPASPAKGVSQPGDAVLVPPPPPARALAIVSRPEAAAALPEPAVEPAPPPPRRPLAVPPALSQVSAADVGPPRSLLASTGGRPAASAPDFARIELPEPQPPAPFAMETAAPRRTEAAAPRRLAPEKGPAATGQAEAPGAAWDRLAALDAPSTPPAPPPVPRPSAALAPDAPARDRPEPVQLALALDGGAARPAAKPAAPGGGALEIAFDGTSRTLPAGSTVELNRIVAELKARPDLTVRLYGAARGAEPHAARELALARAVAVHRYLVSRGVGSAAIKVEPVTGEAAKDAVAVRLVSPA